MTSPMAPRPDPPVLRRLAREHDLLRTLLARLLERQEGSLLSGPRKHRQVAAAAVALYQRLWVHIHQEEEVLFPVLEALQPGGGGPTTNLRASHIHMLEMLSACVGAARALSLPAASGDAVLRDRLALKVHQLSQLLPENLEEEEQVLFHIVRRRLPPGALRGAVARMVAVARAARATAPR